MDHLMSWGGPAVVIDNGSGTMRAGFSGDEKPRLEFPSYVCQAKYENVIPS